MDMLQNQFYDVMHKYEKAFSEAGVQKNLNCWRESKWELRALLSRHPDWNERELAVVFPYDDVRYVDKSCVAEAVFEMEQLAAESGLRESEYTRFDTALHAATQDCKQFISERRLADIREYGGIECVAGQKASRIVNRLCLKFGLDRYTTEKEESSPDGTKTTRTVHPYNAVFARLSDALNPGRVQRTGVLSIHPCDYLEMSNDDNTWRSCHSLNNGEYQAGTLSYMEDTVTMIFYTVSPDVTADFHKVPRITREVFCYYDGTLLQSRLYPSDRADQRECYMGLVEKIIATCLGQPSQWITQAVTQDTRRYWNTASQALHYKDYDYGYGIVSVLQAEGFRHKVFTIGAQAYCVCCGGELTREEEIKCCHCDPWIICKECGKEVRRIDANYDEEQRAFYCKECRTYCDFCHSLVQKPVFHLHRCGHQNSITACQACFESRTGPCRECGTAGICQLIDASRFCKTASWIPDAA